MALLPAAKYEYRKQKNGMTLNQITVSVGGGRELERAGLVALIAGLPGLRVVPIDRNPPPQVLVWVTSGATGELPSVRSDTALLLLTENTEYESLPETVIGLLSEDESPDALGIAIRQVARGEQYLSPSLATAILEKRQSKSVPTESEKSIINTLTEREREILELLAKGLSNKAIAARLYLSVRTVEGHLANIYPSLGVHSRTEAMLMTVRIPKSTGLPLHRP
ncbi:MAG TPA: response regulator transcription factor [Anaerolineales bacterium]|nr:response regulator transcription factor [Anaerolineales bacterium]HLO28058.1 response regulator transcription factor [Anaerolineales bacterium]